MPCNKFHCLQVEMKWEFLEILVWITVHLASSLIRLNCKITLSWLHSGHLGYKQCSTSGYE